jgi:hypothetical protein
MFSYASGILHAQEGGNIPGYIEFTDGTKQEFRNIAQFSDGGKKGVYVTFQGTSRHIPFSSVLEIDFYEWEQTSFHGSKFITFKYRVTTVTGAVATGENNGYDGDGSMIYVKMKDPLTGEVSTIGHNIQKYENGRYSLNIRRVILDPPD